tara:strand:- start:2547 stop:2720 length:174 start_codon:yes stop_codon:yes gene_type:complete
MEAFVYDNERSVYDNFLTWYDMNCRERRIFNEETYELNEAKEVFRKFTGRTVGSIND